MNQYILIIEDDKVIYEELAEFLNNSGYKTAVPDLDRDLIETIKNSDPSLILLDINLPHQDGFALCRKIRSFSQVPIIFITSRDNSMDELNALMMGGDDYITKPYNLPVLLARIQTLLKRTDHITQPAEIISYKGSILNTVSGKMEFQGAAVELTKTELKIMYYLLSRPDQIVPRVDLIEYLWDNQIHIDDNTLSVNVTRLRSKLNEIGIENLIQTKRGMGYKV